MSLSPERRNRLFPVSRTVLVLLLTALMAGCSQDMRDLRSYIHEVKQRPGGSIPPLPIIEPFASFYYPQTATRDPFAPLAFGQPQQPRSNGALSGPRPDLTRPKEALEAYPLGSLAYVGTLQQGDQLWALIRDPDGTIHRVQTGNYMGQHYGRIVAITPTSIKLRELIPNGRGGWMKRMTSLAMND